MHCQQQISNASLHRGRPVRTPDRCATQGLCGQCRTYRECLVHRLGSEAFRELSNLMRNTRPLHRGDRLFRQGEPFRGVFLVQSGSLKSTATRADGESWVSAFHFPGEVLGLEAMNGEYAREARALETTTLCHLSDTMMASLSRATRLEVYEMLVASLADAARRQIDHWQPLNRMPAEQRLASFLAALSGRMAAAGKHPDSFDLRMTRNDIASYLGLAPETLSRLFRRLQEGGLIDATRMHLVIHDLAGLSRLAAA